MFSIFADTMRTATRQDSWDGQSYWQNAESRRAHYENGVARDRSQRRRWFGRTGLL